MTLLLEAICEALLEHPDILRVKNGPYGLMIRYWGIWINIIDMQDNTVKIVPCYVDESTTHTIISMYEPDLLEQIVEAIKAHTNTNQISSI